MSNNGNTTDNLEVLRDRNAYLEEQNRALIAENEILRDTLQKVNATIPEIITTDVTESDDRLREENEIMGDVLRTAGVRLAIHVNTEGQNTQGLRSVESDGRSWPARSANGWQRFYDEKWRTDNAKKRGLSAKDWLFQVGESKVLLMGDEAFMKYLTGKDIGYFDIREQEILAIGVAGWEASGEDRNMDFYLNGGSPNERAFFFAHTVPTSNYEHDPRSGGTEMIAILPESVALRILEAIKKNPEFRMRIIKELIKNRFPIFNKLQPGKEYGNFEFKDNFQLFGPKGG